MEEQIMRSFCFCAAVLAVIPCAAADKGDLADVLLFHASFDKSVDADAARGDGRLYTANSTKREVARPGIEGDAVVLDRQAGRAGGALRFNAKQSNVLFYKGGKNLPYSADGFEGTVSMWMKLSPSEDLPAGFVDPLQITDKAWNDSALFVDFTDKNPRQFRLGVFSDYKFWNPSDRKWDDIPESERPMVTVTSLPFSRERWTHVAFVFRGFNSGEDGAATLYLDGMPQGTLRGKQLFRWQPDSVAIMLGINYVGLIDDLKTFSRELTAEEIRSLAD
jgi:hypothetical protein